MVVPFAEMSAQKCANAPEWGSKSPLTTFASGSKATYDFIWTAPNCSG